MRRFLPLLVALGVAVVTASINLTIDLGVFESGPLSKAGLLHRLELEAFDSMMARRSVD